MLERLFLVILIACSILILSGCSFVADFVVVNNSGDFIEISYETKNKPGYKSITPYLVNLNDFNNNKKEWREIPQDQYKIDSEKPTVEIKLAPNEVLRFESVDASRIQLNPYEELNTKRIKISGKNGSITLEGNQVFEQLKPQTSRWILFGPETGTYAIFYK